MKHLVILGAGTGGTMMAHKLVRALDPSTWRITVVDRDPVHLYQPGLLFLPFGLYEERDILRPRAPLLPPDVHFIGTEIDRVDPEARVVALQSGERLPYDVLVVATGARIAPEETPGMRDSGWHSDVFDFYTLEGARALRNRLAAWEGGRLLVHVVDMPIKCPVAPLEFAFLADDFLKRAGLRKATEIRYVTPLDGAFTKPRAAAALGDLLERKGIRLDTEFSVDRVDPERKVLRAYDGREIDYDLLVTVPLHRGMEAIARSGLGDADGFVPTDRHTLQSQAFDDVFVLGDATDLPVSKAGSVAHFQGEVLVRNVLRHIEGRELLAEFDGHANCFIETGEGKAILIDFNYETEPLPGRFPLPAIGPFSLLAESRVNHWGKLGFRWMYWNMLLRGRELPIDHRMVMAGKWS